MKRLVPSIRKRIVRLLCPDGYGVVKRHGALFLVNSANWADQGIISHGIVERDQIRHFLSQIHHRQCDLFVDIGANIGIYTIFVARETKCRTIFAFEPDQYCYDQLRTNLMLNGLSERVETRPVAISNQDGEIPFEHGPSTHRILSKVGSGSTTKQSVASMRLDTIISCLGCRIALKIDIEGHELIALDGMKRLLEANQCFLQVECWEENSAPFVAEMANCGYVLTHRIDVDHYFANF